MKKGETKKALPEYADARRALASMSHFINPPPRMPTVRKEILGRGPDGRLSTGYERRHMGLRLPGLL